MTGLVTERDRQSPPPFMQGASSRHGPERVRRQQIVEWVADAWGVTVIDLISHRRPPHLVDARALAVWAMRALCDRPSYPSIGKSLGGRDHSTIINLHERAIYLRLKSAKFAGACVDVTRAFESKGNRYARY